MMANKAASSGAIGIQDGNSVQASLQFAHYLFWNRVDPVVPRGEPRAWQATAGMLLCLLFILYTFCSPLVVLPVGERLGTSDVCLPICVLVFCSARWGRRLQLHHFLMALFLASVLLSVTQIRHRGDAVQSIARWMRLVAICLPLFLPVYLNVRAMDIERAIALFISGAGAAIVIGMILHVLQIPMSDEIQKLYNNGKMVYRAGGLIGNTGGFGHLVATWCVVSCSWCLLSDKSRPRWSLFLTVLLISTIVIVAMISKRSSLVALGAGLVVLPVASRLPNRFVFTLMQRLICAAVIVVLMIVVLMCYKDFSMERFIPSKLQSLNSASSGRIRLWMSAMDLPLQNVPFGVGYRNCDEIAVDDHLDSSVLTILVENGACGLGAIVAFIVCVMLELWKRCVLDDKYAQLMFAVWTGQIVNSLFSDTFTMWLCPPSIYFLTGLVLERSRSLRE